VARCWPLIEGLHCDVFYTKTKTDVDSPRLTRRHRGVSNTGWLEPEEGWNPGWPPGTIVLDKRSGLLMEIVDSRMDILYEDELNYDMEPVEERYWAFRVRYLDDGTDPMDGVWRAPEDLVPMTAMEVLAHVAR